MEVIRALFSGETVSYYGSYITVEEARLYVKPETMPKIIGGAALTPETAKVQVAADGMVTVSQPYNKLRKMVGAFHEGGGEGKPMYLQVHLSYSNTDEKARQGGLMSSGKTTLSKVLLKRRFTLQNSLIRLQNI